MTAHVECSYERTVRVAAPIGQLYEELVQVESVVRFDPMIELLGQPEGAHNADVSSDLVIGPIAYHVTGTLSIETLHPLSEISLHLRYPSLLMELFGTLELDRMGDTETNLRYHARASSSHRLVRRMGRSVLGALEGHVDALTDRAAILVGQHAAAERVFEKTEPEG